MHCPIKLEIMLVLILQKQFTLHSLIYIKLRIITLQRKSGPVFKKSNILKFEDKILIGHIFRSKLVNNLLPIFKN